MTVIPFIFHFPKLLLYYLIYYYSSTFLMHLFAKLIPLKFSIVVLSVFLRMFWSSRQLEILCWLSILLVSQVFSICLKSKTDDNKRSQIYWQFKRPDALTIPGPTLTFTTELHWAGNWHWANPHFVCGAVPWLLTTLLRRWLQLGRDSSPYTEDP